MSDGLKRISESIDAVRGTIAVVAHPARGDSTAQAELDILLCQIAAEIRRIGRRPGGDCHAVELAKLIEEKTNA